MESLATGELTPSRRDELIEQVKQQIAVANAQELLAKMVDKCFKKCIDKPGTSLDSHEQDNFFRYCKYRMIPYLPTEYAEFRGKISGMSSNMKCVAMCMDRYLDSWNLISKAYGNRLQKERQRM